MPRAERRAQAATADLLKLPWQIEEGLQENDRTDFPFLDAAALKIAFADFFARPQEGVIGRETADQARLRFQEAVERIVGRFAN